MAGVTPFRRLRWGPPRRLPRPYFLRSRRPRLAGLRRISGFIALAVLICAAALLPGPWREADALGTIGGAHATVVDGDSLRIGGEQVRLIGIDAPELHQTCRDADERQWPCGRAAKARLAAIVSGNDVACTARGRDRYQRMLAVCSVGGIADLGEMLVREGHAVDFGGYRSAETEARLARRGLWAGTFERPQDWRRRHLRNG